MSYMQEDHRIIFCYILLQSIDKTVIRIHICFTCIIRNSKNIGITPKCIIGLVVSSLFSDIQIFACICDYL